MSRTPRLDLPLLAASQAQKHVTHNEALLALDALTHLAVVDRRAAPPAAPTEGSRHLVEAGASGAFAGQAGKVAVYDDGAWRFLDPRAGWLLWVAQDQTPLVHDGDAWIELKTRSADRLGIGTVADATNRLAVASPAALFTHAGSDSRVTVNKAAVGDTASLLFQTNHSGRGEIGLTGNDELHVKLSSDGTNWREAAQFSPDGVTLAGRRLDLGSEIEFHVGEANGALGVTVEVLSSNGTTLADFRLQTEANAITLRNEGRAGDCISGAAPEFQVRFPPPFATSPFAVNPHLVVSNAPHRLRSYMRASLPSPATAGAGAMIYVSDAAGGGVPTFSDGSEWRSVVDRSAVTP